MKEYRIVCDHEVTLQSGRTETEEGALLIDETGRFDRLTFDTVENAEYWLTRAEKHYPKRTNWGTDDVYQYNFRIQSRRVTKWEDAK